MNTIGIDIGGTQLRVAILNEEYEIIDVFKTGNDPAMSCQENCDKLINFIKSQKGEFKGIGIGCPGPLDLKRGKVLNPPNLVGWDNFEIVKYFEQNTGLKVTMSNDANVSGLSEAILGGGKGYESVVFFGLSTGFGGAYVYKGKIVNGANGNAAEWWNMIVDEDPYHHKNANPGSLNEQCSGSGLQRVATRVYGHTVLPKELFMMYNQGEGRAIKIIEDATEKMAKGIANITCVLDPDVIVVGGSVAVYNPFYFDMAMQKARKYMLAPDGVKVEKAVFGDDAGLIGAALLVED